MKLANPKNFLSGAAIATAVACAGGRTAQAVPINGFYTEDARCDPILSQGLHHELGQAAVFPVNEAFTLQTTAVNFTVCVPNDGIQNDWVVQITNVSGIPWQDLFFNCDLGMTVGNADGSIIDVVNAPGVTTDAFRIDGIVTAGVNNNLLFESLGQNEIFEPGEVWRFAVSNFMSATGLAPPPRFRTPGVFAGSSPAVPSPPGITTASILANPVPEPTTTLVLGVIAGALLLRRPRRT